MRFAIFSDIHANLQAWEAVLEDIQSQGVDTLVCLGDVVGYGPMPGPVLESVYQHTDNFVLGNHDAVVGGRIDASTFNDHAQYVIEWTADQLGEDGAAFFAQVPLTLRGEKILFTHGDAARPGHFDYVVKAEDARPSFQACKDEVIFFGHTHHAGVFACATNKGIIDKLPGEDMVLEKGRRYLINPGSVGDPRNASDLRGSYCIYDDTTRRLIFRRVKFDVEAYRADLAASGLEMEPYFLRVIDAGSRRPEEEDELAIVQDHREEIEVDETLTAQPRALVTTGSPMANRRKLHFGYPHPQGQQGHYPPVQAQPPSAPLPHTRPIHQPPAAPQKKQNQTLAILIVGSLIGAVGLIFVLSKFSGPSKADLADVSGAGGGSSKEKEKKPGGGLLDSDGWEDPEGDGDAQGGPERGRSQVDPGPVFSLSSLVEKPFDRYRAKLQEGVKLVRHDGGGQAMRFAKDSSHVVIPEVKESNFGGSITIAAWIKVSPADHDRLIYARAGEEGGGPERFLMITSDKHEKPGCLVFGAQGIKPAQKISSKTNRIDDGKWHFVIGTFNEEIEQVRVYVDGKKNYSRCEGKVSVPEGEILVGGGLDGYGSFDGEIYGLRVFDWGLRTGDVNDLYDRGR